MQTHKNLTDPKEIVSTRRSELGLTQIDLAKKMNYKNPNFISMLENGRSEIPLDKAIELAEALEMDVEWFIERMMFYRHPDLAARIYKKPPATGKATARAA